VFDSLVLVVQGLVRTPFVLSRRGQLKAGHAVTLVRFQNRMPLPCASNEPAPANESAIEAMIHRIVIF
jgi:hypothetical protein